MLLHGNQNYGKRGRINSRAIQGNVQLMAILNCKVNENIGSRIHIN
jgi:hypothetical protein